MDDYPYTIPFDGGSITVNYDPITQDGSLTFSPDGNGVGGTINFNTGDLSAGSGGGTFTYGDWTLGVAPTYGPINGEMRDLGPTISLAYDGEYIEGTLTITPDGYVGHPSDPNASMQPSVDIDFQGEIFGIPLGVKLENITLDALFDRELNGLLADGLLGGAFTAVRHRDREILRAELESQGIHEDPGVPVEGFRNPILDGLIKAMEGTLEALDPLTLDLDGDGIETVSATAGVVFDHDADGVAVGTGWVKADDGMLVLDRNSNGVIDNGRELFGDHTIKSDGTLATSGFDALADLDSNHDGIFSVADAQFANVRVWQDLNQNGVTDAGELRTLAQANVLSINLTPAQTDDVDLGNFNAIDNSGTYTRTDGITRLAGDLLLGANTFYSSFLNPPLTLEGSEPITVSAEVEQLPDIDGSGMVRDLHEAAMMREGLREMLEGLDANMTRDQLLGEARAITIEWAKSSTMLTSRARWEALPGPTQLYYRCQFDGVIDPAVLGHIIDTLEVFNGMTFLDFDEETGEAMPRPGFSTNGYANGVYIVGVLVTLSRTQVEQLQEAYEYLIEGVYGALARQTTLDPFLDLVELQFNLETGISIDFSALNAKLHDMAANGQGALAVERLYDLREHGGMVTLQMDWMVALQDILATAGNDAAAWQEAGELFGAVQLVGNGYAVGTAAANLLLGSDLSDLILGNAGDDTLSGGNANDTLQGGADDDTVDAGHGDDSVLGEAGDDDLDGATGNDSVFGGDGKDRVYGHGGSDSLDGGSDDDTLMGGTGNDTLNGGELYGADLLKGEAGNDLLLGGSGPNGDTLDGGAGNDTLLGWNGAGEDVANEYFGGRGNDVINGSGFADIYHFAKGDGFDVITEAGTYRPHLGEGDDAFYHVDGYRRRDVLKFGDDIVPADVSVTRIGNDLVLSLTGATDAVTIKDWFVWSTRWIESVEFADGTKWSAHYITYELVLPTTVGNDTLAAVNGSNVAFLGQAGDDNLSGANGNDTIDGELGNDMLAGDHGTDLLTGGEGADSIDGGTGDDQLFGGAGNDTLLANDGMDSLDGGDGNDVLVGGSGPSGDTLIGGAGDDLITVDYYAGQVSYANSIVGGTGNDTISGSSCSDHYTFNRGDGVDVVSDTSFVGQVDRLVFGAGIAPADVSVARVGNDLVFTIAGGSDAITFRSWFAHASYWIEVIEFTDGTQWNPHELTYGRVLATTAGADSLAAISGAAATLAGLGGNDTLTGAALADVISGDGGDDSLLGLVGADSLIGGDGHDAVDGGSGDDSLLGNAGNDALFAGEGFDSLDGGDGNDSLVGGAGDYGDTLIGGAGDDTITAFYTAGHVSYANIIVGGTGNDTITGSARSDHYSFNRGDGVDVITDGSYAGEVDRLVFGAGIAPTDVSMARIGDDLVLTVAGGTDIITFKLWFLSASYWIEHVKFADGTNWTADMVNAMFAATTTGSDARTALGGTAANWSGLGGNDMLVGAAANDTLKGDDGNDSLVGNEGNDLLTGGVGADTMIGGLGDDTYFIVDGADAVTELDAQGFDSVQSAVNYSLGSYLENLTLTGSAYFGSGNGAANLITGNDIANLLNGGVGNDTLDGGAGADTLTGGSGNDRFIVDNLGDTTTEAAGEGTADTVAATLTWTLADNVENLELLGSGAINGFGNGLNNVLTGNAGNNVLNGMVGADTMVGGLGNDAYSVNDVGDVVTELTGQGTDTVQASVNYSIETLVNIENVTLFGTAVSVVGNASDNNLTGNASNNSLTGAAGNDTLVGMAGNDTMLGGAGNDVYSVDSATDVVTEALNEGTDLVNAQVTWTLGANVDNLNLLGTAAINGTGNGLANVITGNDAANVLNGGVGADTMTGGLGDDTFAVNESGDVIVEWASQGNDLVQSSISYTLGAELERLTLTGTAISGTGNALDNTITGNASNNSLSGLAGNDFLVGGAGSDTMAGGTGNDTYSVDAAGDVVNEVAGEGTDQVNASVTYTIGATVENLALVGTTAINGTGNTGNNVLTGNTGNNVLTGLDGNDTIIGGAGTDSLVGGLGNDNYRFDLGWGTDTVVDTDTAANADILSFGTGIASANLRFARSGDNLVISIVGASDTITVQNWYLATGNRIETLVFTDGGTLTAAQVEALVLAGGASVGGGGTIVKAATLPGGADPIVGNDDPVATPIVADEPGPAPIEAPVVADEPGAALIDDGNFVPPGDGSYLFDPANWSFDVVRDDGPVWFGGQLGLHGSPQAIGGPRLALLIQAMASMPTNAAESGGIVAVEPPPPAMLVTPGG